MRFLLLFLSLFLQFNAVKANIPQITENEKLSIATNYMGTPEAMYREDGEAVWKCELNSYGKVRKFQGKYVSDCPFRYQGQYEDAETGLYYNRFRYYSADEGMYISQDPIRLKSGEPAFYAYVHNPNAWVDVWGLEGSRMPTWMPTKEGYQRQHIIPYSERNHPIFESSGMDIHNATNMMYLPVAEGKDPNPNKSLHHGYNAAHADYNATMKSRLDDLHSRAMSEGWDQAKIQQEIHDLQHQTRKELNDGKLKCG